MAKPNNVYFQTDIYTQIRHRVPFRAGGHSRIRQCWTSEYQMSSSLFLLHTRLHRTLRRIDVSSTNEETAGLRNMWYHTHHFRALVVDQV